jgi:3'-5' exoribonuclease
MAAPRERLDLSRPTAGTMISGPACLIEIEHKATKAGKPYVSARVRNRTGAIAVRAWDGVDKWDGLGAGSPVWIRGEVRDGWQGGPPELHAADIRRLTDQHPVAAEGVPICPTPLGDLERRWDRLVGRIERRSPRLIIEAVMAAYGEEYRYAPAAVMHHHAYVHGLLEHSVEVAELCDFVGTAEGFGHALDRDVLVAGALIHDIGKILEYQWRGAIAISRPGRLEPHTVTGPALVRDAVGDVEDHTDIVPTDVQHIAHIIVSHHGTKEWGSPLAPATPEAEAVHVADLMSARLRGRLSVCDEVEPDAEGWIDKAPWPHRGAMWFPTLRSGETVESSPTGEPAFTVLQFPDAGGAR